MTPPKESEKLMELNWVSNGDPSRIPPIGSQIQLKPHLFFVVEGYGESEELPGEAIGRPEIEKVYRLTLLGHLLIPKGSPMTTLEDLLNGRLLP